MDVPNISSGEIGFFFLKSSTFRGTRFLRGFFNKWLEVKKCLEKCGIL